MLEIEVERKKEEVARWKVDGVTREVLNNAI